VSLKSNSGSLLFYLFQMSKECPHGNDASLYYTMNIDYHPHIPRKSIAKYIVSSCTTISIQCNKNVDLSSSRLHSSSDLAINGKIARIVCPLWHSIRHAIKYDRVQDASSKLSSRHHVLPPELAMLALTSQSSAAFTASYDTENFASCSTTNAPRKQHMLQTATSAYNSKARRDC
jgi:hypothetical protein